MRAPLLLVTESLKARAQELRIAADKCDRAYDPMGAMGAAASFLAATYRRAADEFDREARGWTALHEKPEVGAQIGCDHKFVDSKHCLKCGWQP